MHIFNAESVVCRTLVYFSTGGNVLLQLFALMTYQIIHLKRMILQRVD
ncbi:hypothetical protein JCM19237_2032 [Photobacterium aphoticum]|uniref:Uncharacterized protein n=1 Tax=Photobacterium aphoticum TaxID=754436 RepID=A0A090QLS9_9GAMM|nr:hypothetical protein JCM19237_2032 [Photobacterium aphoticum]